MDRPLIKISIDELVQPKLLSPKLAAACRSGFFYLEIPSVCKGFIKEAVEMAQSFHKDSSLKNLRLEGYSGYHDREHYQVESLYIEQQFWKSHLPPSLVSLADMMSTLGRYLSKKVLEICHVPEEFWAIASGGVTENKGQAHFVFNHYRSEKAQDGIQAHQDFGQIVLLFINQEGLEAKVQGEWIPVDPLEGYFVVNFGRALETFINDPKQLVASWHRVGRVTKDRISLGIFLDNHLHSSIYQKSSAGEIHKIEDSYATYMEKCFQESYDL